ncbi:MAG: alpha/beta hydrolase [Clostridiales bacterium]|nr:alpha/beta hydrolase [Clostridiales bacterium]
MNNYRNNKAESNIIRTYDELLMQWEIPVEEFDIPSRYGVTHVITAGEKTAKPLFLFHGVGDDSALMWIYNAKELAKHYRIYAVDTIGGPGKSKMGDGYNKDYSDVEWIESLMEAFEIKKACFVGTSHGGYLVQLFTLKRPDMVERAISISGAVPCGSKKGTLRMMMKIFFPEALFPSMKNAVKLLHKMSGDNAAVFTENPLIVEHYYWLLKGFNNMAMKFHKIDPFTEDEIASIREKVFYLAGEKDLFEQMGGKQALLDHGMNVRFYPNAGHGLNHEEAKEINQIIVDILEGNIHNIRNNEKIAR